MATRLNSIAFALTIIFVITGLFGCTFDPAGLEARQCQTDDDCTNGGSCLAGFCQIDACNANSDCDDGLFCNGEEVCNPRDEAADARGCLAGPGADIDDNVACTEDICNEETDEVRHVQTSACECATDADCVAMLDNPSCKTATCSNDFACVVSNRAEGTACVPNASCLVNTSCNFAGECIGMPSDARCNDDLFCNGAELCDPSSDQADDDGCVMGAAPEADDDDIACTASACDEATMTLSQAPTEACDCQIIGESCPDPDPNDCVVFQCGLEYTCEPIPRAANSSCDDGASCTTEDQCNSSGQCIGVENDAVCDDELFCNGSELCDPNDPLAVETTGCINGSPPMESDGLACTTDICDEETDSFRFDPVNCACEMDADCLPDTPNPCLTYTCTNASCVIATRAAGVACNDGVTCTQNDTCDATGRCVGTESDEVCNDGLWCNGVETCRPNHPERDAMGCRTTGAQPLDDGIACTTDACLECDQIGGVNCEQGLGGRVEHDPNSCGCTNDADCAGQFANMPCITGTCNLQSFSCVAMTLDPGAPCEDGVSCTTGSTCDENASCIGGVPNDALCQNASFCDGDESCDAVNGCRMGEDPVAIYRRDNPNLSTCIDLVCDDSLDLVREVPNNMCECDVDADCETPCTTSATCNEGVCEATFRTEGAACQRTCANNPSPVAGQCTTEHLCQVIPEGPTGLAACTDAVDNDCDGFVDGADSDCREPEMLSIDAAATASTGLGQPGVSVSVTATGPLGLATGQSENLYCTNRRLVHDFTAPNGDWITEIQDAGYNVEFTGGADDATNIERGVRLDSTVSTSPLGVKICNGYGVTIGPIEANFPEAAGTYIVVADLGNPAQTGLDAEQYLVMSIRGNVINGFTPQFAVGNGEASALQQTRIVHFGSQNEVFVRFESLSAGPALNNNCGFVSRVRLYRTTLVVTSQLTQLTRPNWEINGSDAVTAEGFERAVGTAFYDDFFTESPSNITHIGQIETSVGVSGSKAVSWRTHANGQVNTERPGTLTLPPSGTLPANLKTLRQQPLWFNAWASLNSESDFDRHDLAHMSYSVQADNLKRLASILPRTGMPPEYGTRSDFIVAELPEEAKTLVNTRLHFSNSGLRSSNARLYLDNNIFFFSNLELQLTSTDTSLAFDGTETHTVTAKAAESGLHEIQCYWQVPGNPDYPTVASEPVFVSFE